MSKAGALLLGRRIYEDFYGFWPNRTDNHSVRSPFTGDRGTSWSERQSPSKWGTLAKEKAVFEILGIVGIAISVAAYVPQVIHLARERCSEGVSSRAWAMWLGSSVLVGLLAVHRGDPMFIMLQANSLISAALILFLARRYRGMVCVPNSRASGSGPHPMAGR